MANIIFELGLLEWKTEYIWEDGYQILAPVGPMDPDDTLYPKDRLEEEVRHQKAVDTILARGHYFLGEEKKHKEAYHAACVRLENARIGLHVNRKEVKRLRQEALKLWKPVRHYAVTMEALPVQLLFKIAHATGDSLSCTKCYEMIAGYTGPPISTPRSV